MWTSTLKETPSDLKLKTMNGRRKSEGIKHWRLVLQIKSNKRTNRVPFETNNRTESADDAVTYGWYLDNNNIGELLYSKCNRFFGIDATQTPFRRRRWRQTAVQRNHRLRKPIEKNTSHLKSFFRLHRSPDNNGFVFLDEEDLRLTPHRPNWANRTNTSNLKNVKILSNDRLLLI